MRYMRKIGRVKMLVSYCNVRRAGVRRLSWLVGVSEEQGGRGGGLKATGVEEERMPVSFNFLSGT